MNRRRVEYFLTAAETLNLTETAERHFITQASISGSIAALEEEIGFKLFDRSRRKLKLTPAGEYFYQACRNIVEIEDKYIQQARHISAFEEHRLMVGTSNGFCFAGAGLLLGEYKRQNPEAEFQFVAMNNDALIENLKTYQLDLALTFHLSVVGTDGDCDEILLEKSRYGVLVPEGHPLARMEAVTPELLKNQDILYPTNYMSDAASTLVNLNRMGIFPTRILKGWSIDQIIMTAMVERCLVLIAEFFVVATSYLDYRFVPFQGEMPDIELTAVKAKANSRPEAVRLFEFLRFSVTERPFSGD